MTLLHYALAGHGTIHGIEFENQLAEVPDELVDDVLANPLWRVATDEEAKSVAPEPEAKPATRKRGKS